MPRPWRRALFQLKSCVRKPDQELPGVLEDGKSYQQYLLMPNAVSQFYGLRGPLSHPWWYRHRKHDFWSWKGHLCWAAGSSVGIHPIDYFALFSCQTNLQRPRKIEVNNWKSEQFDLKRLKHTRVHLVNIIEASSQSNATWTVQRNDLMAKTG